MLRFFLSAGLITLLLVGVGIEGRKQLGYPPIKLESVIQPIEQTEISPTYTAQETYNNASGYWRLVWKIREPASNDVLDSGAAWATITETSDRNHLRIEIIAPTEWRSVLEWDKIASPEYGTWSSDAPGDFVKWSVTRTSENKFEGWCSKRSGSVADLQLTQGY